MSDEILDLDGYFERINYSGSREATEETLNKLHICHAMNVPFENLDVFYKKPPQLDEASLYNKIVKNKRGGYCFEMNGIFSIVLKRLGFKVTDLLAKVFVEGIGYTAKTHQVILVEINGRKWVVDVGFGNDGLLAPLRLEENTDQKQYAHVYNLIKEPQYGYLLRKKTGDKYNNLYAFTLEECRPEDFIMSNHFTATYPESFFLLMRMCTMPTKEGRITLTDTHFKVIENGDIKETEIKNEEEFRTCLKDYFRLDLEKID